MFRLLFLLLALCVQQLLAVDLVVDLGYAKYRGLAQGNQGDVILWAGMRYARSASRTDGMRFAAPQDPLPERTGLEIDATEFGPLCIGAYTKLQNEFGSGQSEDCLFVNVFAPAKATNTSNLPVYVFIQGGGFNTNGNANYNGTKLIEGPEGDMVVVNFNYRVGPYGFLASKEIAQDPSLSLNNGLKDQRQVLRWVKTHISKFGGDPNHVTLGGASAGAGSVILQLTAYGGRNDDLFHAVAAESPAFPPLRNISSSQFAYDALLKATGCQDLKCMREMDAVTFQHAVQSSKISYPGAKSPPLYFWNPTLDYDFVQDYTYNEIKAGRFVKVPSIFGDDTNEGITFVPKGITSLQSTEQFLSDQFTTLNKHDKTSLRRLWGGPPDTSSDPRWRNVASDIYGRIRYTCGGLNISAAYVANGTVPTWQYRWNVGTATHVSEINSIWGNGTSAAGVFIQGYFASFIRSFDPNSYNRNYHLSDDRSLTSPEWDTFGKGNGKRMLFNDANDVHAEDVSQDDRNKCDLITSMGLQLYQATSPAAQPALPFQWTSCLTYLALLFSLAQWFLL